MDTTTVVEATAFDAFRNKNMSRSEPHSAPFKRNPLLTKIYGERVVLLHKIVNKLTQNSTGYHQLLLLGAGLDISYDQYCPRVFAVDRREYLLQQRKSHQSIVNIAADLNDTEELFQKLASSSFDLIAPTIIILECVYTYLNEDSALLQAIAQRIPNSILLLYEPVFPIAKPGDYNEKFLESFRSHGAVPKPSKVSAQAYSRHFRVNGWNHVHCSNVNDALRMFLSREERSALVSEDPFDEFASLALIRKRYIIFVYRQLSSNSHSLVANILDM